MKTLPTSTSSYPRHRFPAEIISHAVWLYYLSSLTLRDVELILAERGVIVTRESVRHWCRKFGAAFACKLAGGVRSRCNGAAAKRFFKHLLCGRDTRRGA